VRIYLQCSHPAIEQIAAAEKRIMEQRERLYRAVRPALQLRGRTVSSRL